jgi:hypothetical protein
MGLVLKTGDTFFTDGAPSLMTVVPLSNTNTRLFVNSRLVFHQGNQLTPHIAPPEVSHNPLISPSPLAVATRVYVEGKPIATSTDISSCNAALILKPTTTTSLSFSPVFAGPPVI